MSVISPGVPERKPKKGLGRVAREALEWVRAFAFAGVAVLRVTTLIAMPIRVEGSSMEGTLHNNEYTVVTRFEYLLGDPARFDVVICHYPDRGGTRFVKRIVGVPGDTVALVNGVLYVNGEAIEEAYIEHRSRDNMPEITVAEGSYFVLGDNRPNSNDSRFVGQLTRDQILGKVRLVAWPPADIRLVE